MRKRCRVVLVLIAINTILFGFQSLLPLPLQAQMIQVFGLSSTGLEAGAAWQFLTHGFLHGGLGHLLFNMLSLWFAGREVEWRIGSGRFLLLYILGTLGGGVLQMAIGQSGVPMIGASGAVFAVLLAFTTIYNEREVYVLLFFIIPLRLKAKTLGRILVGLTVAAMIFQYPSWIAHAAHLGGAITGYLFTRAAGFGKPTFLERWLSRKFQQQH